MRDANVKPAAAAAVAVCMQLSLCVERSDGAASGV